MLLWGSEAGAPRCTSGGEWFDQSGWRGFEGIWAGLDQQDLLRLFLSYAGLSTEQALAMVLDHVMFSGEAGEEIYIPELAGGECCGRVQWLSREAYWALGKYLASRGCDAPGAALVCGEC